MTLTKEQIAQAFNEHKLYEGRMISHSKSWYRRAHPDNVVIFNCNLVADDKKIWWGDIDFTVSEKELMSVAKSLGKTIYAFYESDYRYENEGQRIEDATHKASMYYVITESEVKRIEKRDHV